MTRTPQPAALPLRVRRVLDHLLQTASIELGRQLQVVLYETEVELGRQATPARYNPHEAAQAAALRSLRQHAADLIPRYLGEFEAGFAQLRAPRAPRRAQVVANPSQGLSLVEDTELDEDTMLTDIASRSDSRNSLELQLMGQRFGVLAGAPAFAAEHLPVGPHAMCYALRHASEGLGLPLEARLALYRHFEKVSLAQLPALLHTLNAALAAHGILPHLSFVPVRIRPSTPGQSRVTGAEDPVAEETSVRNPAQASSPSRPEAGGALDGFAGLQELLARRRQLLAKLRSAARQERVLDTLSSDDVLAAVRHMRTSPAKTGVPGIIRQTLLAQARQAHGHGVSLGDADNDGFELFGLFFGQLQREMRRNSHGDVLVESLKLPLLQLGLRDHRFFVDPAHPARTLLNAVSLAGAHWLAEDDLDPQWLGLLQRAVSTVQEDQDAGDDTFIAANHALQGGLQVVARKNALAERRHVDAARGREKLELARLRASAEIASLVDGRQLPRFHGLLLEQAWTDVLSLVLLRSGEGSAAWRDIHDATSAIIDAGAGPVEGKPRPALLATLQEGLGQVGYHAEDAAVIARQLANGRADDADLASRTELMVQIRARTRLGEDKLAHARSALPPRTPAEEAAYARLGGARSSSWIDLHDPAQDSVVRRRLVWSSMRTGRALVLNRRSLRVDGEDLDGLARKMAAGRVQLVEHDIHPAELAWQLTLSNLQRIAGEHPNTAEDAHDP